MSRFIERHPAWALVTILAVAFLLCLVLAPWPAGLEERSGASASSSPRCSTASRSAALYFLVASGFTLIFGLMRNVNLAHGSLYLLGGYLGYEYRATSPASWLLSLVVAFVVVARRSASCCSSRSSAGWRGRTCARRWSPSAISIVLADLMLWGWGGDFYQVADARLAHRARAAAVRHGACAQRRGRLAAPIPLVRLAILAGAVVIGVLMWLALNRTRIGMLIRAGVDDRDMLSATGVRVQLVFVAASSPSGPGSPGLAGVVGGTFQSLQPGEDTKILLASLVVVIVGGMGSIPGAALGALLIGLAEQFGSVYMPTYAVVLTFLIMVLVLALRPQGLAARALSDGGRSLPRRRGSAAAAPAAPASAERCGATRRSGSSALFLLILPAFASDFVLIQIFGWTLHPRHDRAQPDVPRRLRRHGQPRADDGRGLRRLHGRDPRHAAPSPRSASAGPGGSRCPSRS